jgi:hypothetical protein
MGNHRRADGLHSSFEKKPTPIRPHTPIAKLEDIIKRFISADNSARAPTFAPPSSIVAPGIGKLIPNDVVHVLPTAWLAPSRDAHALNPKFAGEAQGRIHTDAPTEIYV